MRAPRVSDCWLRWPLTGLALFVCLLAQRPTAQTDGRRLDLDPPPAATLPAEICGTDFEHFRAQNLAVPLELADGQALMFDQIPAIIRPDLSGNFATMLLVGDFSTMQFHRWDPDTSSSPIRSR